MQQQSPTILTPFELRRFSHQIDDENIGIYGQEALKYSKVVIQGLNGIGIAVMRCLLAAGVGDVNIIDDRIVTEDMLPSQTLFGLDDVGKPRCIAARAKQIGGLRDSSLMLHNIKLKDDNFDKITEGANIFIRAAWIDELTPKLFDIANEQKLRVIGGVGLKWKAYLGSYANSKQKEFIEIYKHLHKKVIDGYDDHFDCFSFVSSHVGGLLAGKAVKILLGKDHNVSDIYEINMFNFGIVKLL